MYLYLRNIQIGNSKIKNHKQSHCVKCKIYILECAGSNCSICYDFYCSVCAKKYLVSSNWNCKKCHVLSIEKNKFDMHRRQYLRQMVAMLNQNDTKKKYIRHINDQIELVKFEINKYCII